jgi:hypothetical protein
MVTACLLLIKEFIMARKWFAESLVQPCPHFLKGIFKPKKEQGSTKSTNT